MTTPRLIKTPAQQPDLYELLAQPIELGELPERYTPRELPAPPVPMLRGTRDYGQVLHQIRALLMLACFLGASIVMMLAAVTHRIVNAPSGADALVPVYGRTALQLYVPGPDPAADYYAHVVYQDGTERDLQVGAYMTERPVRIEFAVTAPEGAETSCRIALDGVAVAGETAADGRTATCRWEAP